MFKALLAADIGSMNMRFATKNGVLKEACCLSVEQGDGIHVSAIGDEAASKRGSSIAYPVREGAVANMRLLAIILRRIACEMTGKRNPSYVEFHAAVPRVLGAIKQNSLKQAIKLAGFREIEFQDALLMGAIGAGMDVFSDTASMLVNIGADTLSCAAIANGGILWESFNLSGSSMVDRAIQQYFREEHRLLIGERTAEAIKQNLDKHSFCVDGRSCQSGFPQTVTVDGVSVRMAAEASVLVMIRAIVDSIKALQADAAADLIENGITLIGGGAKQFGLAQLFSERLGVPITVAGNADTAVADGMKDYLIDRPRYFEGVRLGYATPSDMSRIG